MADTRSSFWRRLLRYTLLTSAGMLLLSVLLVAILRFVDPWTSSVILRARLDSWSDDEKGVLHVKRRWRDFDQISPQLALAVIASEDQRFPEHSGFDFKQIQKAMDDAERGRRSRGASTITQQVAKNVFLWNGRSWARKGLEAWFTLLIELLWPKQRILEVYLNIAEFGPGIYGAEAAAQEFFHKPAKSLGRAEAARLAAVLPSPRRMRAGRPSAYVQTRQRQIETQMAALGGTSYLAPLSR